MDESIVIKAKKGDKDSFSKIIESVKNDAYKIAYCYLHDENESLDAVCDSVEKAFYSINKLREPKYFKTWFIRIVINQCKSVLRKKKKIVPLTEDIYNKNATNNVSSNNLDEIIQLRMLLKELPQLERGLIYMKYYMGYTLEEIADIQGMPIGTVKTKIYKNLKLLRAKMA